jgi:hypothetical protein
MKRTVLFATLAVLLVPASANAKHSMMIGMGNVGSLGCTNLPLASSFVRVVEGWPESDTDRHFPCAVAAHKAGLRVELVIQWSNALNIPQIKQRVKRALAAYRTIKPFAIALGNEQEFSMTGGVSITPQRYAAEFRATVPMVVRKFPRAIRIAGEVSPWGNGFMKKAANAGLPHAQVYAEHVYPSKLDPAVVLNPFTRVARIHHVQAWADEGLCGPGNWMNYGCVSASVLRRHGFTLAAEWYDANSIL